MPTPWRAGWLGVLPVCLAAAAVIPTFARQPAREALTGRWEYNEQDSVNAATGRPELGAGPQRPLSAGHPTPAPRGPADPSVPPMPRATPPPRPAGSMPSDVPGGSVMGAGGPPPDGFSATGMDGGSFGTVGGGSALAAAELRYTQRDLLEMARRWTITVTADAVMFKDDLDRERTYPLNGKKQKYQLGAAQYDAAIHWDGAQLVKEVEAAFGFRMTETYSLSADGARLFAIIRVIGKGPNAPVVGANRVYDRIR